MTSLARPSQSPLAPRRNGGLQAHFQSFSVIVAMGHLAVLSVRLKSKALQPVAEVQRHMHSSSHSTLGKLLSAERPSHSSSWTESALLALW